MLGGAGVSDEAYDFIVVAAARPVARLPMRSRDLRNRVLIIEAGGSDNWIWFHIPVGYLYAIGNPRADWMFKTAAVPAWAAARSPTRAAGSAGGATINAMIYMRGQAADDLDGWRQLGLAGWGWRTRCPISSARRTTTAGPAASMAGAANGGWSARGCRGRSWTPCARPGLKSAFRRSTTSISGTTKGRLFRGQPAPRAALERDGFLKPILKRPNLRLVTESAGGTNSVEGRRATGLRYSRDGLSHDARAAREVILAAAGAIGTPQLLELSGVGRPEICPDASASPSCMHCPELGKTCRTICSCARFSAFRCVHRPQNVHFQSPFKQAMMEAPSTACPRRRGPMTMAPSQSGMFAKSSPAYATANIEFHVQPVASLLRRAAA